MVPDGVSGTKWDQVVGTINRAFSCFGSNVILLARVWLLGLKKNFGQPLADSEETPLAWLQTFAQDLGAAMSIAARTLVAFG